MIELLVNKKSSRRVLGLLIVYNKAQDQYVMQIAMPLGVMVQNERCSPRTPIRRGPALPSLRHTGCYAITPLDNDAIKALGVRPKRR